MYLNLLKKASDPDPKLAQALLAVGELAQRFRPRLINAAWADSRTALLLRLRTAIESQAEELAHILSQEAGRPIAACKLEVRRSLQTIEKTAVALQKLTSPQAYDFSQYPSRLHH